MALGDCQSETKVSRVKVEENGKKAVFVNDKKEKFVRTAFDGCVVKNGIAADWVVSKKGVGDVIVELKGRDVERGTKQVHATAEWLTNNNARNGAIAGLVVCRQYPRESTIAQRAQLAFKNVFDGLLHVRCSNQEYDFESLLSVKKQV